MRARAGTPPAGMTRTRRVRITGYGVVMATRGWLFLLGTAAAVAGVIAADIWLWRLVG